MKERIYLVVYKWESTKQNHTGMYYYAAQLASKYSVIELINEPPYARAYDSSIIKLKKILWSFKLFIKLAFLASSDCDTVFFMEYLGNGWQKNIARFIRVFNKKIKLVGLVHLPINYLLEANYSEQQISNDCNLCSELIVFGTSLKKDLENLQVKVNINKIFHYVDLNYYYPRLTKNNTLTIIVYGNIMRDFKLLYEIISGLRDLEIQFIVCLGFLTDIWGFKNLKNVILHQYLTEDELIKHISSSDVNLSVMTDTIGSNTIVTSMACGLAQVCSDVGSIRDYCNDSNALFCNNDASSFKNAIKLIHNDKNLLEKMKLNSITLSKSFDMNICLNQIHDLLIVDCN